MNYKVALLVIAVIVSGCANPYQKFYQGEEDARRVPGYVQSSEAVRIFSSNNIEQDRRDLQRRGYVQVGGSTFEAGGNVSKDQLLEQAEKIGAQIVLAGSAYARTDTSVVPIITPTNSTSYSSGSATAYGSRGGSVTAYGTSTTTTYGTTTNFVPVTDVRNNYGAAYFAKVKHKLGVFTKPMTDEQRRQLQSNTGVVIDIVVDGSPAFVADVLPGDILVSIDGIPMVARESVTSALANSYAGKPVKLVLRRDGNAAVEKIVALAR